MTTGVLVIAGSSGRRDVQRAELIATTGARSESIRWFGGPGQNPGPWEIPMELFAERVSALRRTCDRIVLVGTSFGAEAALLLASLTSDVDAVAAFAPSDVVWAGVAPDRVTSHWTWRNEPVAYVPFDERWGPDADPPEFRGLYLASRDRFGDEVATATIATERIPELLLVAGGDDRVWPSDLHAAAIESRRATHGLSTTVLRDPEAGHRTVLPGESVVTAGIRMARGGTPEADRRLGVRAWEALQALL